MYLIQIDVISAIRHLLFDKLMIWH